MRFGRYCFHLLLILFILASISGASDITLEEKMFLAMYFSEEELRIVSATRSLKSITRVAENITVVTAEEIELLNAHTLADVLRWVNGVQVYSRGGIGSSSVALIQASEFRHVTVFMDGVRLNDLSDNAAQIGVIPVQFIDKIEIIKGPASSAWGSSLGGVINIITKSAGNRETAGGMVSVNLGEQTTGDFRGELYGRKGAFGYYLQGGWLMTDGQPGTVPGNDFSGGNFYSKLTYDLSKDTSIRFTLSYWNDSRGQYRLSDKSLTSEDKQFLSTLSLATALSQELNLDVSLRANSLKNPFSGTNAGSVFKGELKDTTYGGSIKLTYNRGAHAAVVGFDYDRGTYKSTEDTGTKERETRWAIFANDTISIGKFTITPGLRYDIQDPFGNFVSPSVGITYQLFDNTILRGYVARGFHNIGLASYVDSPSIGYKANPDLKPEEVWSYQIGAETTALKYVWLKVALFRNDINDVRKQVDIPNDQFTEINGEKQRRQGLEIDFRSVPFYHFTLNGGFTFVDTKDLDTDETVRNIPRYTYDLGIKYDDEKSLKVLITGHYIWWNTSGDLGGKYNSFIIDVTAAKTLLKQGSRQAEVFFAGHNIFNGSQYTDSRFPNPQRWIEGGIRFKF